MQLNFDMVKLNYGTAYPRSQYHTEAQFIRKLGFTYFYNLPFVFGKSNFQPINKHANTVRRVFAFALSGFRVADLNK